MIKRAFKQRVDIERKVLGRVNDACGEPYLTGLSRRSFDRWKSTNPAASHELTSVLERISLRARLDADGSRDVFDSEELGSTGAMEQLLDQLSLGLKNLCSWRIGDTGVK